MYDTRMAATCGVCPQGDVSTLETFCRLAQPQIVPSFAEIRRQFANEFNYTCEAANLELVRRAGNMHFEPSILGLVCILCLSVCHMT
jgi:hypothetical protein